MFIRRLPEFEHHGPLPVSEALRLLAKYGDKAQVSMQEARICWRP
jgi:hypothetical protein